MNMKATYDALVKAQARQAEIAGQINTLFDGDKVDEGLVLKPQLDAAKETVKQLGELYASMLDMSSGQSGGNAGQRFVPANGDAEPKEVADLRSSREYAQDFWAAFKNGVSPKSIQAGMHSAERYSRLMNALTETGGSPAGSEGGFLNPVEFDGKIHERMRQFLDLAGHVNVEEVTALTGWRSVEVATAELPFVAMTENEDMDETENPTFKKVDYSVNDYGGFLPVSNDLLNDTPVNIMNYLSRWFGKKVILTNNSLILALVNALTPVPVTDKTKLFTAIKTAFNKTLDPAIAASAEVWTNQSGFDLLDELVDGDGRPLLQPDPSNDTQYRVKGRLVVVLADRLWANLSGPTRSRMAIGDGNELITFFRRAAFEMASTTIGGDAWRKNNTEVRGIMRADVQVIDDAAMTLLSITN